MRSQIDLKRLRHVLEVARAQAITTAAQTLGVTQSALSRSIAEVEDELGTALFHRLPRGIELTPAGERFVRGARRVLGDVDALIAQTRSARELGGGRLRIGIAPASYVVHASRALAAFARQHPGVALEVMTGSTQALCPRLLNGEFDLLIGSSSYLKRWRDLELEPVAAMHVACMVRTAHPLLTATEPPREIDVLRYPLILPESIEPIYSDIGQRFVHHGLPPFQPHYVVEDFEVARRLVGSTDAVYPLTHPDPGFGRIGRHVALLREVLKIPPHFISIARAARRPQGAAAQRFGELFAESLATDPSA